MNSLYVSLILLVVVFLVIYVVTIIRTRRWKQNVKEAPLKGLALPDGSIRGLLAFLVVGAFVLFIFFGKEAVGVTQADGTIDTSLYTTVLTAFGTLTGAISGFYFGSRTTAENESDDEGNDNT